MSVPSLALSPLAATPVPAALQAIAPAAATPERPSAPRASVRVRAHAFDLDGNVFGPGFPTKIILFKKGGNQELAVPTAHFAALESKVGTDYVYGGANLRDYELRGAQSFRNFFGPQFVIDLQYAVVNLPPSEWQGPSWDAFVRSLSDPRLAEQVYVLTARQHSSEDILEGFKYLQAAGYIKFLPKVGNLHGVGGTYRTAERKAELMIKFLDALQSSPIGAENGPHTMGFSDDTWTNYEKMRGTLIALLKSQPGRWSTVKISLFYTGTNDIAHRPEAIVLNDDGTTRPR